MNLLHNPDAGSTLPKKQLLELLAAAGHDVRYCSSKASRRAREKALASEADLVAVAGGDGTVLKAVEALIGRSVPIAIVPFGTANNIARSIGVNGSPREVIASWSRLRPRAIDVGVARADSRETLFLESAVGGVVATLMDDAPDRFHGRALSAQRQLNEARRLLERLVSEELASEWQVEIDGRDCSGTYVLVAAVHLPWLGPSLRLSRASPWDGAFDVVLCGEDDRRSLRALVAAQRRGLAQWPRLPTRRGRQVRLRSTDASLRVGDERLEKKQVKSGVELALCAAAIEILAPVRGR